MPDDPIPEGAIDDVPVMPEASPEFVDADWVDRFITPVAEPPLVVEAEIPSPLEEYEALKAQSAAADKIGDEAEILRIKPLKMAAYKKWLASK